MSNYDRFRLVLAVLARCYLLASFLLALLPSVTCAQPQVSPVAESARRHPPNEPRVARWAGRDLPERTEQVADTTESIVPSEGESLTVADLESMALANNPTLAQAAHRMQALEGKYVQVGLRPNPIMGYVGEEIGDEGLAGQQGAFVAQQIITAGKLGLNRAVVGHEISRASEELEIQRRRVLNDVRSASFEAISAQRRIDLSRQLARLGDESVAVTEELLKAQVASRIDLLQARIEANSARLQRDNAVSDFQSVWRKLAAVIGVPTLEPKWIATELDQDIPQLSWEESLSELLSTSPEIARAVAEMERGQCALARAQAGRIPNVDVEAGVRYNFASQDPVATVRVAVPLQFYNRNQGNIIQAQAELAAAQQEIARVELALQERLAEAFRQYSAAGQQVVRYRSDMLPDAQQSLDLALQAYREGELGYLDLLTAQRTFFRTNLAYIDALRILRVSAVGIEGLLLNGGLARAGQ